MARAGSSVHATVDVAGRSSSDVMRAVEQALSGDPEYRSAPAGPDSIQLVRTYRPTWALACGWAGLLVFGLGLLCFLVRRTESCTMTVVNGPTGAVLTVTGRLLPDRLAAIRAALSGRDEGIVSPSPSQSPPVAGSLAASVPAAVDLVAAAPPSVEHTVARVATRAGAPDGPPEPRFTIRLGDGRTLALEGTVLLGRDPAPRPGAEPRPSLVRLVDPALQVSKTHLSLRVDRGAVIAEDLHSTNGSTVIDIRGRRTELVAGKAERIEPGSSVQLGNLSIEVHASG